MTKHFIVRRAEIVRGLRRQIAIAGVWAVLLVCGGCDNTSILDDGFRGTPTAGSARSFRMGFSPFPHDQTTEAVDWVNGFLAENADVVAHYLEGVPWTEALAGMPYDPDLDRDWERERSADHPNSKSFVAMTPIDWGRTTLAAYRAEAEGLPLPPAFETATFDDPRVISAYLTHCLRAIEFFEPDYLCIGIEVNELFHQSRAEWGAYVELHQAVYTALKRAYPDLPIFISFSLQNMLNVGWEDRGEMLEAFKELMPYSDFVGVSFYPFTTLLSSEVESVFIWLRTEFTEFGKPFIISESGETAEPIVISALDVEIPGSEPQQESVMASILALADTVDMEFVIWYIPRDFDAAFERIRGEVPDFFRVWQHAGLIDGAGAPRPAFAHWDRHFARPYVPVDTQR